jgi:quercetin dioxygenase-like cupin family protein
MKWLLAGTLALLVTLPATARETKIAVYDLAGMPMLEASATLRLKKVMGQIGTFALGQFVAGIKSTNPHHHTHEQINVGLTSWLEQKVGGVPHRVAELQGTLIAADVVHGPIMTPEDAAPTFIEFQPVRRTDLPPERVKSAFPIAATEMPLPQGWRVALDFTSTSSDWERLSNGVRAKASTGKGVSVSAWQIPASATAPFDLQLHVPGAEQFAYIVSGAVEIGSGNERHQVKAGALLVNPPDSRPMQARAISTAAATLLVFEAAKTQ